MRKILIIQTAFIGDVILATALVESLAKTFPNARIDFVLRKGNAALLQSNPHLRKVYVWNKNQRKYRGLWKLLKKIRRERYDLVVNTQRFFATGFLTALSRATHRVGFRKNPLSFAFTEAHDHKIGGTHEIERNHTLIKSWTDESPARPKLYPSAEDRRLAESPKPYICIAPTSVWYTKQLPAEKWIELINRLPENHRIYLLGGPGDQSACAAIQRQSSHPQVINRAGTLSLPASAALMEKAAMNYVNDSAPLHLASAMNAPVTAVFCSTIPAFGFTPLSDQSKVVETRHQLSCRPCGLHGKSACPEGHFKCGDLSIEDLL